MTEYRGGSSVAYWLWSGGSLNLSAETRSLSVGPEVETLDVTASQDTDKSYLRSFDSWRVQWSGVAQNSAAGTLYAQALQQGNNGLLYLYPYGIFSRALVYNGSAVCSGVTLTEPYADVTTISTAWLVNEMAVGYYVAGSDLSGTSSGTSRLNGRLASQFIVGSGIVGISYIGA